MPEEEWRPGSFTKNYSWGPREHGLKHLHEAIRVGFNGKMTNTTRKEFRERISSLKRPDYIPTNFFLFNKLENNIDYIIADELVFQAVTFPHSKRFDQLATFAFNLSIVGTWKGARSYQARPALWAFHYISDHFGPELGWESNLATADDIQRFVSSNPRYTGEGSRKLATNLAYFYSQGNLGGLKSKKVERWWVDALFLTLDRILEVRQISGKKTPEKNYESYLLSSGFFQVGGNRSIEKNLAAKHLVRLYIACGGIKRFDDDAIRERTAIFFRDVQNFITNNNDPIGALHRSNVRIIKSLPKICSLMARYADFEIFDIEELESMDTSELARENVLRALESLSNQGIKPTTSSEELMKILRGE